MENLGHAIKHLECILKMLIYARREIFDLGLREADKNFPQISY